MNVKGNISPAPTAPEEALKIAIRIKPTSEATIAVYHKNDGIVMFRFTKLHGKRRFRCCCESV